MFQGIITTCNPENDAYFTGDQYLIYHLQHNFAQTPIITNQM